MSDYDLKKLFALDAPLPLVAKNLPESQMMDEVLICGLPEEFKPERLMTILYMDCSERGMALPALIWQSSPTVDDGTAILLVLQEPVHRETITDSLMECIEDMMDDMKIDILDQAYSLEFAVKHGFAEAVEYIKRNYPGPHPNP